MSLIDETSPVSASREVVYRHRNGDSSSLIESATLLNSYDTVSIQHEFGIFGGIDGAEAIDFMSEITVPTAVTFHTVLDRPSRHQHEIVRRLAAAADAVVVMSNAASQRLTHRYGIDPDLIVSIPHGADVLLNGPSLATGRRPLVLTWGLIGPGKGLEAAIEALASLTDLDPLPRYLIAGATHPHVVHSSGESYRESLFAQVRRLGLDHMVEFDGRFRDRPSLARLVRSADVVLLPYESLEQVTSGVLVEAIAAGKPVVATEFPHAMELLGSGAGITVPHANVPALAAGIRAVVADTARRGQMAVHARRLADDWYWPTIGQKFSTLMRTMAATGHRVDWQRAIGVTRVAG